MTYKNIDTGMRPDSHEAISLRELNTLIHNIIKDTLPDTYWLRAETSDVHENRSSGHCYLEFVEKNERTEQIVAKARGMVWSSTYQMLKPYFEAETGRAFASGMKVLVCVSVEFHELYGYSLVVHDIEPSFTLGDMVRKRVEIIHRLHEEGIFDLNRALELSEIPQRLAIVSSPTAAGYGDFIDQLTNNDYGFQFYTKLFPAMMQGDQMERCIIAAMDKIFEHQDMFDAVVIIRGGGSSTDLGYFDSYPLAAHCAQFPLPIITGIGHERDDSIVDMVAHTRLKTPTAVAAFFIGRMAEQSNLIAELQETICAEVTDILHGQKERLQNLAARFPTLITSSIEHQRADLSRNTSRLLTIPHILTNHKDRLSELPWKIGKASHLLLIRRLNEIGMHEQFLKMASPEYVLKRGYTLTLKDGKIVKKASALHKGDSINIQFADGTKNGTIVE